MPASGTGGLSKDSGMHAKSKETSSQASQNNLTTTLSSMVNGLYQNQQKSNNFSFQTNSSAQNSGIQDIFTVSHSQNAHNSSFKQIILGDTSFQPPKSDYNAVFSKADDKGIRRLDVFTNTRSGENSPFKEEKPKRSDFLQRNEGKTLEDQILSEFKGVSSFVSRGGDSSKNKREGKSKNFIQFRQEKEKNDNQIGSSEFVNYKGESIFSKTLSRDCLREELKEISPNHRQLGESSSLAVIEESPSHLQANLKREYLEGLFQKINNGPVSKLRPDLGEETSDPVEKAKENKLAEFEVPQKKGDLRIIQNRVYHQFCQNQSPFLAPLEGSEAKAFGNKAPFGRAPQSPPHGSIRPSFLGYAEINRKKEERLKKTQKEPREKSKKYLVILEHSNEKGKEIQKNGLSGDKTKEHESPFQRLFKHSKPELVVKRNTWLSDEMRRGNKAIQPQTFNKKLESEINFYTQQHLGNTRKLSNVEPNNEDSPLPRLDQDLLQESHKAKRMLCKTSEPADFCAPCCGMEAYQYNNVIGQGSYAAVRLAVEKRTGKKVAVKIYEKSKLSDPQKMKNVKREIEILKDMHHENVVQMLNDFETARQIHIVTEYAGAQSLADYCKKKPGRKLDDSEAKQLMRQILLALIYIHSQGVMHRDLKMDNVMINSHQKIKLIDFGFSVKCQKNTKISVFCGTPAYMAPEIVSKKDYTGAMADVWAVGVLFYKMVTGVYPFRGNSDKELFQKISIGKFDFPSGVSAQVRNLISRILKVNPVDRPSPSQVFFDFLL